MGHKGKNGWEVVLRILYMLQRCTHTLPPGDGHGLYPAPPCDLWWQSVIDFHEGRSLCKC